MERIERPVSTIYRIGIAPAPAPKESGVKRVLYGVWDNTKKAVESQGPEAWKGRILKIIDRQIIPRLPPDQQQWFDDHWEGIQEAATYAGVCVTTAEIVGAVAITKYGFDKASSAVLNHRIEAHQKKYPATPKPLPVTWASEPGSMTAVEYALRPSLKDPNPDFTKWMIGVVSEYKEKYGDNPTDVSRFAMTMRNLAAEAGDISHQGTKREWVNVLGKALDRHPWRARSRLKKIFTNSYKDILRSEGLIAGVGTGKSVQDALAQRAYDQWANIQFPGLGNLLYLGQPYPDVDAQVAGFAASDLTHNAKDFESIKALSPLARYEAALRHPSAFLDPGTKYELDQDPNPMWWTLDKRYPKEIQIDPEHHIVVQVSDRMKHIQDLYAQHKEYQAEQELMKSVMDQLDAIRAENNSYSGIRDHLIDGKERIAAKLYRMEPILRGEHPHEVEEIVQLLDRVWDMRTQSEIRQLIQNLHTARADHSMPEARTYARQLFDRALKSNKNLQKQLGIQGDYYQVHDALDNLATLWINSLRGMGISDLLPQK